MIGIRSIKKNAGAKAPALEVHSGKSRARRPGTYLTSLACRAKESVATKAALQYLEAPVPEDVSPVMPAHFDLLRLVS